MNLIGPSSAETLISCLQAKHVTDVVYDISTPLVQPLSHFVTHEVVMEAFLNKYKAKLNDFSVPARNGQCVIWTGATHKNGKYGVVQYKHPLNNTWHSIHAHRLAKLLSLRLLDMPPYIDASHICHNSLCVNPDHISFEPHGFNNQRQICVVANKCFGHPDPLPECLVHLKF